MGSRISPLALQNCSTMAADSFAARHDLVRLTHGGWLLSDSRFWTTGFYRNRPPSTANLQLSSGRPHLRSAAGKTVGEAEEVPLSVTLIPVLALLSNYDQGNCLIHVGTEGVIATMRMQKSERT
jgi:hypothetical protein